MSGTQRFGNIMMCFIPLISAIALQFIVSIPLAGIALLYTLFHGYRNEYFDPSKYYVELVGSSEFSTWILLLYAIAVVAIFGFWYYKMFAKKGSMPVKQAFQPLMVPGLILAAMAWYYLAQYIATFTAAISPKSLEYFEDLMDSNGFDDMSLLLILYAVIIGPICEELLFRGVTLGFAKRAMPFWLANLFQAVLFGAFHMNVMQGVYAFFLGLVMGWICEKCGNIAFSMAFHVLYNGWTTFAPDWIMYRADEVPFFILWLTVGILLAILSGVIFAVALRKRKSASAFIAG